MTDALGIAPPAPPVEEIAPQDEDAVGDLIDNMVDPVSDQLQQLGIDLHRGEDGTIQIGPGPRDRGPRDPGTERRGGELERQGAGDNDGPG
jgi:penicillin-binding protein 1A